jgi:hypothetical protein
MAATGRDCGNQDAHDGSLPERRGLEKEKEGIAIFFPREAVDYRQLVEWARLIVNSRNVWRS